MTTPESVCGSCGAAVVGRFCSQCGAPMAKHHCTGCGVELSQGARFCHRCGAAARPGIPPRQERTAWLIAGVLVLAAVGAVGYLVGRGDGPTRQVPAMGNAGNAQAPGAVRPPDISTMTPRERFDRLFDRILRAAEAQATDTVAMFAPMALAAYGQLDQVDDDARYHAAMIHLVVGELAEATALADTILAGHPKHLFGFVIQGEVAEQRNDRAALDRAYAAFRAAYDAEIKSGRREYLEHQPVLDDFRNRALANAS